MSDNKLNIVLVLLYVTVSLVIMLTSFGAALSFANDMLSAL